MRWVLALTIASVCAGCGNRSADVVGVWMWNKDRVTFEDNWSWSSVEVGSSGRSGQNDGGWECSGDVVHLWITVIDGPAPHFRFRVSKDGRKLVGETAEDGLLTRIEGEASR